MYDFAISLLIKCNMRFIRADYIHRIVQSIIHVYSIKAASSVKCINRYERFEYRIRAFFYQYRIKYHFNVYRTLIKCFKNKIYVVVNRNTIVSLTSYLIIFLSHSLLNYIEFRFYRILNGLLHILIFINSFKNLYFFH